MAKLFKHHNKEAIRIKAKKYDGSAPPETRKFSIDPQLTSYEVLQSILAKAFDISEEFSISYHMCDDLNHEIYSAIFSDWELDAAFLRAHNESLANAASEPSLCLRIDMKSDKYQYQNEWSVAHSTFPKTSVPEGKTSQRLPGIIKNQMEKTFSLFQKALNLSDENTYFQPPRNPLSDTEFREFLNPIGQIVQAKELRFVIYSGGIEPSLRKVVWKHLLNVYPDGMSGKERMDYMKKKASEYNVLKNTWKQALENGPITDDLAYTTSMIRKDVLRTDRHHSFYSGSDDNQNITSLYNILTTYALNHPKVNYCQGMSDLASPLLVVMCDEAHAYICFCALMQRLGHNFMLDGIAMTKKFTHLAEALLYYDPEFYAYLKMNQADDLLFCYRWLLLEMKREFAFDDALHMLEVLWSSLPPTPPQKELKLYDTLFKPSAITPPISPLMRTPRENAYSKVCALRKQYSSLSISDSVKRKYKNSVKRKIHSFDEPKRMEISVNKKNEYSKSLDDSNILNKTPNGLPKSQSRMSLEQNIDNIIEMISHSQQISNESILDNDYSSNTSSNDSEKADKRLSTPLDIDKDSSDDESSIKVASTTASTESIPTSNSPFMTDLNQIKNVKLNEATSNKNGYIITDSNTNLTDCTHARTSIFSTDSNTNLTDTNSTKNSTFFTDSTSNLTDSNSHLTDSNFGLNLAFLANSKRVGHFKDLKERISKRNLFTSKIETIEYRSNIRNYFNKCRDEITKYNAESIPLRRYNSEGRGLTSGDTNTGFSESQSALSRFKSDEKGISTGERSRVLGRFHSEGQGLTLTDAKAALRFKIEQLTPLVKDGNENNKFSDDKKQLRFSQTSSSGVENNDISSMEKTGPTPASENTRIGFPFNTRREKQTNPFLSPDEEGPFPTANSGNLSSDSIMDTKSTIEKYFLMASSLARNVSSSNILTPGSATQSSDEDLTRKSNNPFLQRPNSGDIFVWENPLHQDSPAGSDISTKKSTDDEINGDEKAINQQTLSPYSLQIALDDNGCSISGENDSDKPNQKAIPSLNPSLLSIQQEEMTNSCEEVTENVDFKNACLVLPPPNDFGGGNPFLMFLCITLLLQHRDFVIRKRMDYNEMAMHFDKMVRKHNVIRVLNQARQMYAVYVKQYSRYKKSASTENVEDC